MWFTSKYWEGLLQHTLELADVMAVCALRKFGSKTQFSIIEICTGTRLNNQNSLYCGAVHGGPLWPRYKCWQCRTDLQVFQSFIMPLADLSELPLLTRSLFVRQLEPHSSLPLLNDFTQYNTQQWFQVRFPSVKSVHFVGCLYQSMIWLTFSLQETLITSVFCTSN